jgi:hypothetical protein
MRKLIWITLIIATLVTSMFLVANVHAATSVAGTINFDTSWTLVNSPYKLTGTVFVNPGVTLTIEPGATVDFNMYSLQINGGTLIAQGKSDNKIIFYSSYPYSSLSISISSGTSWNEITGTGSIIENAVFNSAYISISSCSPKISNNYFTNNRYTSLNIVNGSSLILNNSFDTQSTGIYVSSSVPCSPTISSNFVKCTNIGSYGINVVSNNAYVSDNNVTGCYMGVYATGNATITNNLVRNNTYGIYFPSNTANAVSVVGNIVSNNSIGISIGGGSIRNNTIGNNQVGIAISNASANITQNNIFGSTQYNLGMSTQNAADVTYNWWGTTDNSVINQTIYDNKNSTSLGKANFTPFLNASNPAAPALETINYVPNPTPTAIPSPVPAPTPTYVPIPTNNTRVPTPTATPSTPPSPTPTPSPTPVPTPSPTPKIMPGSPLSLGGSTFAETISQFDITNIAKMVLAVLGAIWLIVILVSVERKYTKKDDKDNNAKNIAKN